MIKIELLKVENDNPPNEQPLQYQNEDEETQKLIEQM